jgi:cell division protein FtsB
VNVKETKKKQCQTKKLKSLLLFLGHTKRYNCEFGKQKEAKAYNNYYTDHCHPNETNPVT